MYPAKTAETIEMPFRGSTFVDPRNHVLDGGRDPSTGMDDFGGYPARWKELGVSAAANAAKGVI